jgi:hypothetical protein
MRRGYFVAATLAIASLVAGAAYAQNRDFLLRGTFSVTATQTCLLSIGGFNADLTPNAFSFVTTTTSVGTAVLNGDGAGSETDHDVSVTLPPLADGSSDTATFNFTYHVAADRTVTAENDGPITGQILTGVAAGQTFTIPVAAPTTGKLSEDNRTVTQAVTDPVIQTISFSSGLVQQRICTRSSVSIKVEEDTDHDVDGAR